ncbi:hypothetical protein GMORB2_1797 [Geosmithia morbida]|uniref:CVC domain-containing protein n=1 Tax=Geosmithia morbida TaxID=1094350 RepID=A0A9P4YSS4_9HYPO|nr:uncharacterized protein GMORB2_1797 [Geosmithia morbida]KAF4121390.1 hypothetical protein GMORB2_1797 [Geosmithia morbida]
MAAIFALGSLVLFGYEHVDPDFIGLAFEQSSWVRYALDDYGSVNQFSQNLIAAIYNRTGGTPIIRIGGTSPDYGHYLPGQEQPALPIAEQDNYQDIGGTTIGPAFWDITRQFPGAKYMVQVPLATTNVSETIAWAKSAVEGIGLDKIHSIQLGNEPDLYSDTFHGARDEYLGPPDFQGTLGNETYVGNYTKYAAAIREAIDLPDKFFTAFDVASHVDDQSVAVWLLHPKRCFELGIDKENIIKEVSHHYYQNHAGGAEDLETGLMDVSVTHKNLDYLQSRINWLRENRPDLPFIINEIGNSLQVTNSYSYQARLGSALWAVDFVLYSLSIGVRRFNFQQIMHSGFDLWLPVTSSGLDPQVFATFYAQPFLGDFISNSGKTTVSKVTINGGDANPNLVAYVAYNDNQPQRLAVINLDYWNRTSSGIERPVTEVTFTVSEAADTVHVDRLSSPDGAGADASTIAYAGSQWTYESLGKEVKGVRDDSDEVQGEDGTFTVKVPSSEAVIINLQ